MKQGAWVARLQERGSPAWEYLLAVPAQLLAGHRPRGSRFDHWRGVHSAISAHLSALALNLFDQLDVRGSS